MGNFSLSAIALSLAMGEGTFRYQGVNIPIDLILSDFARDAGLTVEKIWVWQGHAIAFIPILSHRTLWLATLDELWVDGQLVATSSGFDFTSQLFSLLVAPSGDRQV